MRQPTSKVFVHQLEFGDEGFCGWNRVHLTKLSELRQERCDECQVRHWKRGNVDQMIEKDATQGLCPS